MIRYPVQLLIVVFGVALAGTGCQTYKSQARTMTSAWAAGNTRPAAMEFANTADRCGATDSVIWCLEAGAAYRACGDFTNSNRYLDRAAELIDRFDEEAKVKLGAEFAALMSNQQNLPYVGRSYDKIMLHTYKALNLLALGEIDNARPEIIRAFQCQQDAVEDNKRRIEKAMEAEQQSKDREIIERSRANPQFAELEQLGARSVEGFKFYADYVNPFTVYLDGLYFLYTGVSPADWERARKSLNRVIEVAGNNKFVEADLELAEKNGVPLDLPPRTYILFETGQAPSRDQIRIDVPIIISRLSYVGAAVPKLVFHGDHATELLVRAGDVEEKTLPLASMDSIVALDFKNEWPIILSKTLISTAAKAAAAYAINDAAARQSTVAGLIAKVATAAAQAAVNIADTRCWTTLPKEFQVACVPTPADRKIVLATPGSKPVEVALVDGTVNVVCVRSINASAPLTVNQFKLR